MRSQVFTLTDRGRLNIGDQRMPPFPAKRTVNVTVDVNDRDSKRVVLAYSIVGMEALTHRTILANPDGSFSLPVYDEFEYTVLAYSYDEKRKQSFASDPVTINKNTANGLLRLVIKER